MSITPPTSVTYEWWLNDGQTVNGTSLGRCSWSFWCGILWNKADTLELFFKFTGVILGGGISIINSSSGHNFYQSWLYLRILSCVGQRAMLTIILLLRNRQPMDMIAWRCGIKRGIYDKKQYASLNMDNQIERMSWNNLRWCFLDYHIMNSTD